MENEIKKLITKYEKENKKEGYKDDIFEIEFVVKDLKYLLGLYQIKYHTEVKTHEITNFEAGAI